MKGDTFELPLKDRDLFVQLVAYLRSIYSFDKIPPEFVDYSKSTNKTTNDESVGFVPDTRLIGVPNPAGFWSF